MNVLPLEKQIAIISALTEGCSIRSVERLEHVHRDTIMRLGVRVGAACARLHDRTMHSVRVNRIELDEAWSYVGKKQKRLKETDGADKGDQYVFLALAGTAKAILSYRIGSQFPSIEYFCFERISVGWSKSSVWLREKNPCDGR